MELVERDIMNSVDQTEIVMGLQMTRQWEFPTFIFKWKGAISTLTVIPLIEPCLESEDGRKIETLSLYKKIYGILYTELDTALLYFQGPLCPTTTSWST